MLGLSPLSAGEARAEEIDSARAEALFQKGRSLMNEGETDKACRALEASLEIHRAPGTLLNLAKCYELQGKIATSWGLYGDAATLSRREGQDKRAALAQRQRDELSPRVSHVVLSIDDVDDKFIVVLDGAVLPPGALDVPFPIDPGDHKLEVSRSGYESQSVLFEIEEVPIGSAAREVTVRVPRLQAKAPQLEEDSPPPSTEPATSEPESRGPNPLWWWGLSGIGVGVLAGGAGVGLGFAAKTHENNADCDVDDFCSTAGLEQRAEAKRRLTTAYVVGISGGALLLVGGATLVIAGLKDQDDKPRVAAALALGQFSGVQISGSF